MGHRLLMCPPTHYRVAYAINPWMTPHIGDRAGDAHRQWARYVELLQCTADVEIQYADPHAHTPDSVFTANAALISGPLAVVSSFRHVERRQEQQPFRRWFSHHGFATTSLADVFFEGAGDALFDRLQPLLYVGYGWRSEREAAYRLSEMLGTRAVALRLVDPHFYHLDTCFCPLASGHVMVHFDAFSPQSQRLIRRTIDPDRLIEVSREDALAFACNAVEIGDAIFLHGATRKLTEQLQAAGYRVMATDLSEFLKAGGSAKCLTLRLDDGPAQSQMSAVSVA